MTATPRTYRLMLGDIPGRAAMEARLRRGHKEQ